MDNAIDPDDSYIWPDARLFLIIDATAPYVLIDPDRGALYALAMAELMVRYDLGEECLVGDPVEAAGRVSTAVAAKRDAAVLGGS